MNAVANIFDTNADGFIDYYEFLSALHPSRDPYRKTLDADQINEEVGRLNRQNNVQFLQMRGANIIYFLNRSVDRYHSVAAQKDSK